MLNYHNKKFVDIIVGARPNFIKAFPVYTALKECKKYDLKMKLSRMSNEKMKMIKKIKEKEMSYYNTVGQHDGEVPFKRDDQKYVPFMKNSQQTYQNSRGQTLQVPRPIGKYY